MLFIILALSYSSRWEITDAIKRISKDIEKKKINSNEIKEDSSIIFIVGMPRSGSTLIEQIISNHKKVFGGDELNILNDLVKKYLYKDKNEFLIENIKNLSREDFKKIGKEYTDKLNQIWFHD